MKKKNPENGIPRETVYYTDPLRDEFSTAVIAPKKIGASYRYDRETGLSRLLCGFWYRIVATPIAFVYLKAKLGHTVVGREKLKLAKNSGFFIYGNHTQVVGDALIPSFIRFPKKPSVIVHPNNVSMPYLGRVTPYMGAIPLPDDMGAARNFTRLLEKRVKAGRAIFIYPEAHIWPYYTGIRPFTDDSFHYPVRYDTPVYCFTNVYKKRRHGAHPRVVSYIDGPFYPDTSLPRAERKKELRDRVYRAMCERSRLSEVVWIDYKPKSGCEASETREFASETADE